MTEMTAERTLFENEEWSVLDGGLEHKRTGYFIERDELANRRPDGLWSWPFHMAEKSWCTMPAFTEAFTCAAAIYGFAADAALARSFEVARCEIAPWPRTARAHRLIAAGGAGLPVLRSGERAPIYVEPERIGRSPRASCPPAPSPDEGLRARAADPHFVWAEARAGRIGRAGTRIVRLLRAALTMRRASPAE